MKKSLSLILAIAMVFSMFASVAFAGATVPADAGKYLQELKVIEGGEGGDLMADANWKRQDVTVLLSRLLGVEAAAKATAKSHTFTDVSDKFYDGYISWAKANKYFEGKSDTSFGYDDQITNQEFAAVVLRALGVDTTGDNFAKTADLAVAKGIVAAGTDFAANAKRGDTYKAIVAALSVEVGTTGKTLGATLKLPGFEVATLALAEVAQTGAKKITVNFNKAVTATEKAELTFELKNGLVPYSVTPKWADDNKSVVLEASFLPVSDYKLTVKGFDAKDVKIVEAKVAKVEIQTVNLQLMDASDLKIKAFNQFNEEVSNPGLTISAYHNGTAILASDTADGKLDLATLTAKVDDTVTVTAFHPSTGSSATKTFKVVAKATPSKIELGTVAPLKDKAHISVSQNGLVLPYTMVDQYGEKYLLSGARVVSGNKVSYGDVDFYVNNPATGTVVDPTSFAVDADGKLTFSTGTTAGTISITVVNGKTAANHSTTLEVKATAALKTFQMNHPGVLVVNGEKFKMPYAAADTFGAEIAAKDFSGYKSQVTFTSSNGVAVPVTTSFTNKGEMEVTFTGTGSTTLFAWVNGQIASQVNFEVKAPATPVKIQAVKADVARTLAYGASATLASDKVEFIDNYGRVKNVADLPAGYGVTYAEDTTSAILSLTGAGGNVVTAGTAAGTEKVTIGLDTNTSDATTTATAGTTLEVTFTVVANDKVTAFAVTAVPTIFAWDVAKTTLPQTSFDKALTLTGKTAEGTDVAIVATNFYTAITSSDTSVAEINGTSVRGVAKGTATIAFWKGAEKIAETTVTVSDAAPVMTTVKFTQATAALNGASATANQTVTISGLLEVKDQYGVAITPTGVWGSSKTDVAVMSAPGVVREATAAVNGETVVSYVTANGLVATITVDVTNN